VTFGKGFVLSFAAFLISSGLAAACVPGGLTADDQPVADDVADDEAAVDAPDAAVDDDYSGGWPFPTPCPFTGPDRHLCWPGPTDTSGIAAEPDDGM